MTTRLWREAALLALVVASASCHARPQDSPPPRVQEDATYRRIASALDRVWAIDNHTHLIRDANFIPAADPALPLLLRSTNPEIRRALYERFGFGQELSFQDAVTRATESRKRSIGDRGPENYYLAHLDAVHVRVVLVNLLEPPSFRHERVRWVPYATALLFPLPANGFSSRDPKTPGEVAGFQRSVAATAKSLGVDATPADLQGYIDLVVRIIEQWQKDGAVALKFEDAYYRTLRFERVPFEEASALYAKGRNTELSRAEYIRLQDHLAWRIFALAGQRKLPVHIHSSMGVPPFLRLQDADVRNLEEVLTDPALFTTQFVLIHGGLPLTLDAAYLALKEHVWIDLSALPFLLPPSDLARVVRQYLLFAPEKVMFGTDASNNPGVPVGPEIQHIVLVRAARDALYRALCSLVDEGIVNEKAAIAMGRGVLYDNAARLYGWNPGGS